MSNWKYTVNLQPEFQQAQCGERTIRTLIPVIVERFRVVLPKHLFENCVPLLQALSELVKNPSTTDVYADDFDEHFQYLYDWADANHVWIKTFS